MVDVIILTGWVVVFSGGRESSKDMFGAVQSVGCVLSCKVWNEIKQIVLTEWMSAWWRMT